MEGFICTQSLSQHVAILCPLKLGDKISPLQRTKKIFECSKGLYVCCSEFFQELILSERKKQILSYTPIILFVHHELKRNSLLVSDTPEYFILVLFLYCNTHQGTAYVRTKEESRKGISSKKFCYSFFDPGIIGVSRNKRSTPQLFKP